MLDRWITNVRIVARYCLMGNLKRQGLTVLYVLPCNQGFIKLFFHATCFAVLFR